MKIAYTKLYVNDQDKALAFYTDTLGFVKKEDVKAEEYRWLTVMSADDQSGATLILESNSDPVAKAFQEGVFNQNSVAINFEVNDVQAEYDRLKTAGVEFTMEPTEVMRGVTIAIFNDTCGNLVQIQNTGK